MPPSPVGPPRVSPGETVDGVSVPRGVYVSADIWSFTRDPRNVEGPAGPEVFEPSRWIHTGRTRPYSAPFIIGPRMYIGVKIAWLEMRVTLAKMVYASDWQLKDAEGKDWLERCQLLQLWKKPTLKVDGPGRSEAKRNIGKRYFKVVWINASQQGGLKHSSSPYGPPRPARPSQL